ncbi:MAG: peptide-methionine (R)-S-oxide reductase MsrB [Sulfurimonadaceae bacterium]|jgi:peptide-methionine (R)-S-oxide reductase|nr:peptide-methionine (R)-S-oxide reductase MsrB [Sulfurimonadaceae bacterium]
MRVKLTNPEYKKLLLPEVYSVTREHGTEAPFSGKYNSHYETGTYSCICCDALLFDSSTKFDSKSGWPSFYNALPNALQEIKDKSYGMIRTEVLCNNCDAHLGHVFEDGPAPSGLRYCINSVCLDFKPSEDL